MFYPIDSLKRGGRFYLCWLADSWPLRFAAITHRQLWSQDIRQLCEDLLEVMINESGRPSHRFSLRLSSKLLRGLVRFYERKATVLLGDLCMINAHVFKSTNKKFVAKDVQERPLRRLPQLLAPGAVVEEPEEQRVEEMIQNSGNVVSNIQDITLKEAVIPEFQLPPNDNFGEENPDQNLQALLADRTIEHMMRDASGAHVSGLGQSDLSADRLGDKSGDKLGDKTADRSRPALLTPRMEAAAELDVSLFRKSTAEGIPPPYDKDVPEIPEIPPPDLPATGIEPIPPQIQVEETIPEEIPAPPPETVTKKNAPAKMRQSVPADNELEELEAAPARRRRRAPIVDKRTKLSSDFLRARLDNPRVEMRLEDFTEAIIDIRAPVDVLFRNPAHGMRLTSRLCPLLGRLYQRNLAPARGIPLAERPEQQKETEQPRQRRTRSTTTLEKIAEVEEPQPQLGAPLVSTELDATRRATKGPEEAMIVIEAPNITAEVPNITAEAMNITAEAMNITTGDPNVTIEPLKVVDVPNVEQPDPHQMQVDIADLPTQKLETLSQVARKRASDYESPAKRQRSMGYVSYRESQQKSMQPPEIIIDDPDKENIPPEVQDAPPAPVERLETLHQSQAEAARMLLEAGLCERGTNGGDKGASGGEKGANGGRGGETKTRTQDSDSTETQLGSLDRTKVSLGDSVNTTDTQRFLRAEWGVEGTMMKVLLLSRGAGGARGTASAVPFARLLSAGPRPPGRARIAVARCFTSILKLKQHSFIRVEKDPDTLEIRHLNLGPRFDNL